MGSSAETKRLMRPRRPRNLSQLLLLPLQQQLLFLPPKTSPWTRTPRSQLPPRLLPQQQLSLQLLTPQLLHPSQQSQQLHRRLKSPTEGQRNPQRDETVHSESNNK